MGTLIEKATVSKRRKQKFRPSTNGHLISHWANRSGSYKFLEIFDEETSQPDGVYEGPRYWKGKKPIRHYVSIKNHSDLINALQCITSGESNQDHYKNVLGLNRERLHVAQALRDRSMHIDVQYIARAGYPDLGKLLGFN